MPRMLIAPRLALRPLALAAAMMICATTMSVHAQSGSAHTPSPSPHIASPSGTLLSVSAQAEAKRVPDIATMSAGVVTQGSDANAAMRANAEQMAGVVAAIKAAGIAERDIQTSGVNLYPQYDHSDNPQVPRITGYQASNTVNITVRDIGELGETLDALVASGANQVNGPSFDVDDKESAYDEARRNAIETARTRATMYAQTLGMRVRRIVSISEGGGFAAPQPMPMMSMARMEKSQADTSISPGENKLSVNLDVIFELGN